MADEIIIETTSAEVIEVGVVGPQGPAGAAGTGLETLTTKGDTLYRGTSTGERLPIGTTGQILRVSASGIPEWGAAPASGVSSVNGETGAITLDAADVGAAATNHSHQPSAIYCDAVDVADTTLSGGEPNGIYFRDGSDNGKAVYKSAQGYSLFWDEGEEEWVLGNVPQTAKYYIGTGNTEYPWQATSWALGPQGSGDTPVVDQALLSNFQRNAAQDAVSTRTPKTGNASSAEVVLGSDTRLTNSRTPTAHTHEIATLASTGADEGDLPVAQGDGTVAWQNGTTWAGLNITAADVGAAAATHASAHASGGSDPLFDQDLNTTDNPTFASLSTPSITGDLWESTTQNASIVFDDNTLQLNAENFAFNGLGSLALGDHTHGNLTNDGKLGSTAGLPVVTTTAGAVTTLALGTAGQVLTVNSGATGVEFAAASGGGVTTGSVDNAILRADGTGGSTSQGSAFIIADNATASPNNTVNHASIQATGGSTNVSVSIVPKGTGSFSLQVPNSGTGGGNVRGARAVDFQTSRSAATQVASGTGTVICGGTNNTSSGTECSVVGGSGNSASNFWTFVGGGNGNVCNSESCAIVGGVGNSTTSGFRSFIGCGFSNTASGGSSAHTVVVGGEANTSSAQYAAILGGAQAVADRYGFQSHAAGRFAANGDAQRIRAVLRRVTTNNTATELFLDGVSVRLTVPANKVISGIINIHGVRSDGSATAHFVRQFQVKNVAGTSSYPYTAETVGTDFASGTSITFNDPDTNGDALSVSVTGIASQTWRWTASVDAVETTYGT